MSLENNNYILADKSFIHKMSLENNNYILVDKSAINKMSPDNINIVITPNLLRTNHQGICLQDSVLKLLHLQLFYFCALVEIERVR